MDFNIYEKGNEVARAIPGSQLEIELLAFDFVLKGTTANPHPTDRAVPSLSQSAIKTKTSANKETLQQIEQEIRGTGTGLGA